MNRALGEPTQGGGSVRIILVEPLQPFPRDSRTLCGLPPVCATSENILVVLPLRVKRILVFGMRVKAGK